MSEETTADGTSRRRKRLKPEERQAQILGAAEELFGHHGYWGTSLQDIANHCHFTVAGVLYHFESKEALLRALLDSLDRAYINDATREGGDKTSTYRLGDPLEGVDLASICRVLVLISAKDVSRTRLYSMLENESTDPRHPAHDFFLRREQRLLDSYEVIVARKVERPLSIARMAMGLISGLRVQWLRDPEGLDILAMWDSMVEGIPLLRRDADRSGGDGSDPEQG